MTTRKRCKAITKEGTRCKNYAMEGSDFCHIPIHQPEQEQIKHFFEKHKEGIVGLLAGAITDPIADDLYDWLKEQLGMKHLVPPVTEDDSADPLGIRGVASVGSASEHYKQHHDADSLERLVAQLKIGMGRADMIMLLGAPDSEGFYQNAYTKEWFDRPTYIGRDKDNLPHLELSIEINREIDRIERFHFGWVFDPDPTPALLEALEKAGRVEKPIKSSSR